jgi:peptidoglycan hydrolase-like protein with peptidoglycan-binding domain
VGSAVVELQELLQAHGFRVNATGEFDSRTEDCLLIFQRRQGLRVDAVVGPKTWAALKTTVTLGDRILRKGLTGLDVYELQGLLRVNGYNIPRDGFFGPVTHQAVVQFQQHHKLRDDGKVDRITCSILKNPG